MNELFEFKDAILTVHLPQDLDHPQSDWIRKETDRIMSRTYVKRIVFDFENTEFMDSSGIDHGAIPGAGDGAEVYHGSQYRQSY